MGGWGRLAFFLLSCAPLPACALKATPPRTAAESAKAGPPAFSDESGPLARYRSRRLALSVPLPHGKEWRIDDHSRPELVATHDETRSRVQVAVFYTDEIVGRSQCEALSRAQRLVPSGDLYTLEDSTAVTQGTFDTRIWVAISPGVGPGGALSGHVMAFGGHLRKCFAFVFSTQVASAAEEPALSSRLAFARARILGGLELDVLGALPRGDPAH